MFDAAAWRFVVTVTNELMFETLKALRADIARIETKVDDLGADLRSMKAHDAAFMQSEVVQDSAIASIRARLERIEKRLDIPEG